MSDLQIEFSPPAAWVTLNRPAKHNAVTAQMWGALPAVARQVETMPSIRAVLLRGAGTAAFSAGADIAEMRQNLAQPERMREMQAAVQVAMEAWARVSVPTIAVIRGACTGGGCGLTLACDLRIATPDSYFSVPPARLGLVYSLADSRRLVDLVGPSRAKDILFTARRIEAAEALAIGLVNEIVPSERLETRALEFVATIAANAGHSVRSAKTIVNAIAAGAMAETAESRRLYDESFSSPEFAEGARAFLEKRAPRF
jgi:enoyl-CoA hydratase/carnithine racemase